MATKLIPEELDLLIKEYLTDGVLTPKERQVILKKAEKMGLDIDEIDLYLDAQEQKIEQATDAAVRKRKGKTCPWCQGDVPMLATKCPHCDKIITAEATEELQEIFENLEEALVEMKDGKQYSRNKATVERYTRKARMYYGENPKVQKLLAEVDAEMKRAELNATLTNAKETGASVLNWILDTIKYLGKNRWFWAAVPFVVGIIFFTTGNDTFEFLGLITFFIGFLVLSLAAALKEKDDE